MNRFLPLLLLAACADSPSDDVVGPFTGESRRFVVDSIKLPMNNTLAREYGGDLNGDKARDNQLGMVIGTLASQGDITNYGDDIIDAGAIASSVIITADDFVNDPSVSVLYLGADGDTGIEVGGSLTGGVFTPNWTRETSVPGAASLHLPVFVDADPSVIPVIGLEIELTSDGSGGFDAAIHGGVPHAKAIAAAHTGIAQMIAQAPADHIVMRSMLDANHDGTITREEFETNSLIESLMAADLELDGQEALSFGFRAHFMPCADGSCALTPSASCFDRVVNGDETDVDCGGSCGACIEGATCSTATDCESHDCTGSVCGPPSCTNGFRDGLETDVDCGQGCGPCAVGKACLYSSDCTSGQCGAPCPPDDIFCGSPWSLETCR